MQGRRDRVLALLGDPTRDRERVLVRICGSCVQEVGVSGAGVTVMSGDGQRGLAHATDGIARELEDLQLTVGEGPCVDAFLGRGPVLVPDLDADSNRWPGFSPHAVAAGVCAVFSFPLQVGTARLGVLDLYRSTTGELSAGEIADALIFADLATNALLIRSDAGDASLGNLEGVDTHAVGMVMVQLSVDAAEALLRLRGFAYAHDRLVSDVARDVIERRLTLEGDAR